MHLVLAIIVMVLCGFNLVWNGLLARLKIAILLLRLLDPIGILEGSVGLYWKVVFGVEITLFVVPPIIPAAFVFMVI